LLADSYKSRKGDGAPTSRSFVHIQTGPCERAEALLLAFPLSPPIVEFLSCPSIRPPRTPFSFLLPHFIVLIFFIAFSSSFPFNMLTDLHQSREGDWRTGAPTGRPFVHIETGPRERAERDTRFSFLSLPHSGIFLSPSPSPSFPFIFLLIFPSTCLLIYTRVAKVIGVEEHQQADHLYILKLDLGKERRGTLLSAFSPRPSPSPSFPFIFLLLFPSTR
jgi:tRNA-binding EMAP/Myf-like protein